MRCPTIIGIKFDEKSIKGIARIKQLNELSSVLVKIVALGTFANIFLGNKVPEITFNIYNSDWHLFHEALNTVPSLVKISIKNEALAQIFDHMDDPKQRQFWEAIVDGCSIE